MPAKAPATYSAKISSKGQVTVPIAIRKRLGVGAGDRIEFVAERDRTVVKPGHAKDFRKVLAKYAGALGPFPGGREGIIQWVRDMRDEDE